MLFIFGPLDCMEKKPLHCKRGSVFVCSGRGLHSCGPLAATPGTNLCSNNVHVMDLLFGIPRSPWEGNHFKICLWLNETQKYLLRYSRPFLLPSWFCRSLSEDSCALPVFLVIFKPPTTREHPNPLSAIQYCLYRSICNWDMLKKKKIKSLCNSLFFLFF